MQGPNGAMNGAAPDVGYGPGDGSGEKRQREEDYGPNKRSGGPANGMSDGPETVYRLLCDQSIVGGIIGRGGEKINAIQQSTGAFIQAIQDSPPHCLERVIVVAGPRAARPGEMHNDAQRALFELFDTQLQLDRNASGPVLRCATLLVFTMLEAASRH